MSEANNLQAPWTALPEINRFPREKKTTTKKQQPIRSEWGGGRRSGLLNINQQVSGERGESCGDAVSGPISISCSPARLQPRLRSDFYSTRQATSGTVTLFRSIIPAVLYTNHDMMHLWLSHPWRAGGGHLSSAEISASTGSEMISLFRRAVLSTSHDEAPLGRANSNRRLSFLCCQSWQPMGLCYSY